MIIYTVFMLNVFIQYGLDEGNDTDTPNYYGAYIRDLDGNKMHIYTILN